MQSALTVWTSPEVSRTTPALSCPPSVLFCRRFLIPSPRTSLKGFSVRYIIFQHQQHLSPKPPSTAMPTIHTNKRMFLKTRSTIDKACVSPLRPSHLRATKQTWLHPSAARVSQKSVARDGADAEGLETGTGNLSAPSTLKMAQIKRRHLAYVSGDCHHQPCRPS